MGITRTCNSVAYYQGSVGIMVNFYSFKKRLDPLQYFSEFNATHRICKFFHCYFYWSRKPLSRLVRCSHLIDPFPAHICYQQCF